MSDLLRVQSLVKRYGGVLATDHVDLRVHAGQCHALIGPNGAGKTTLIHQLSGSVACDAGQVYFCGEDITHWPMHRRAQHGLSRSFQITSVFVRLSVLDNLVMALRAHKPHAHSPWSLAVQDQSTREQALALAERLGLTARLDAVAGDLSHGQQRQLEVALAMACEPQLVLLDEPMAGLGPDESQDMLQWLKSLRGQVAMLLVEHDMDAVFALADTVSVLVAGRVLASGTPVSIRDNPDVKAAYLGDEWQGGAL